MKIRIKGNSIRYRLSKSDVTTLGMLGFLSEFTHFASHTLEYAVRRTSEEKLTADFANNKIVLNIPLEMITELVNTEKVGFSDSSGTVSLLIEKDFACLDNVTEDQSDNFPNPNLNC
ncbi:hypothetical protein FFJ24_012730 [Pedobacter sp. KBS0701]|uniref:DUF7009 family protein n=1 Tax=Pedobacter sp. KBS0701 TaxID=2578106 RepID=UPI00110F5DC6|nr:hypothetical protein [Pedobacter sp. KBS0701]QDW25634.1 hypothetical protein FFJ24_012730 [Pedobacter sp. KBS0701]